MKIRRETFYRLLLGASFVFTAAGAVTLVPNPFTYTLNMFGYRSICSFVPFSTLACFLAAGVTCTVRARLFGPGFARRSPAAPIVAAILLAALAVAAYPSWRQFREDLSGPFQTDISDPELGTVQGTIPEDPDFPPVTTIPRQKDNDTDWID